MRITLLTLALSIPALAEHPFEQFLGEYQLITKNHCTVNGEDRSGIWNDLTGYLIYKNNNDYRLRRIFVSGWNEFGLNKGDLGFHGGTTEVSGKQEYALRTATTMVSGPNAIFIQEFTEIKKTGAVFKITDGRKENSYYSNGPWAFSCEFLLRKKTASTSRTKNVKFLQ